MILNQNQKDKLQILMDECPVERLKQFAKDSLSKYISGEIEPVQHTSGLISNEDGILIGLRNQCCIVGSALIGDHHLQWIDVKYNLNLSDISTIIQTFDGIISEFQIQDVIEYIKEIRVIIFGK